MSQTYKEFASHIMERSQLKSVKPRLDQYWKEVFTVCKQAWQTHPMLTFCAAVAIITSFPPIIGFLGFVAASLFITLLGFICVEGFLIVGGLLVLGAILGVLLFIAAIFCIFTLTGWLLLQQISKLAQDRKVKEKQNGENASTEDISQNKED